MTSLRQVLKDVLGDREARYTEQDIQKLVDNDYTDKAALQTATRDGLTKAGLTPGKVDELLAKFSGAAIMLSCTEQQAVCVTRRCGAGQSEHNGINSSSCQPNSSVAAAIAARQPSTT